MKNTNTVGTMIELRNGAEVPENAVICRGQFIKRGMFPAFDDTISEMRGDHAAAIKLPDSLEIGRTMAVIVA